MSNMNAFNPFRVIPVLQVDRGRVVKTTGYRDPSYVGDLINSLRIFNEKEVDEIAVVDISATREGRGPDFELINQMASECFMPLAYGGGISSVKEIERIIQLGVETVEAAGAGEILLNAISLDGTFGGYDHALIKTVSARTSLPVIASGGAANSEDLVRAVQQSGASAVAAGALCIYRGPHRAVLLSYPSAQQLHAHMINNETN